MLPHIVNIIPTYNEKENIPICLGQFDRIARENHKYLWSTLVIDDNSPDGTSLLVKKFKSKWMNVVLLSGKRQGLGIAMCRGLKFATSKMKADIIITNEADLAYDARLIPRLLKKFNAGWDVVLSTRHGKGAGVQGWTINRKLNHFIANKIFASWIAGINNIKDHNGAFRAVRVKGILDRIDWDSLSIKGFAFFNYWCFLLTTLTDKIYQLPITYKFRSRGESKVSFNPKYFKTYFRDVVEYIFLCFKIRFLSLCQK
jgi:dolichol-phosphate mannosyltransferase